MGSKSGYEYQYRVSLGYEFREEEGFPMPRWRTYFLEVQTKFILKPGAAEEVVMDTERFGDRLAVGDDDLPRNFKGTKVFELISGKNKVDDHIRFRLSKYCMPEAHIRALCQMVFDFVRDPKYDSFHTIPILASINVYTVQLEGEPLDATIDRAVIPDSLIPIQLRMTWKSPSLGFFPDLQLYLLKLPVLRVREDVADDDVRVREDVDIDMDSCSICLDEGNFFEEGFIPDKYAFHEKHSIGRKEGLGLMEECSICLRQPIVGAKIASLPCKHAFHDHCIFRWLLMCQWCPVCCVEIKFKPEYTKYSRKGDPYFY